MNGYQNPLLNPFGYFQQQMPQMQPQQQVTKVNGEPGARAYQMGANSSAWLLDESGLVSWLVTTDGAGYKTVSCYDISQHRSAEAQGLESLENRIRRLEEMMNGYAGNSSTARKKQSYAADGEADDGYGQGGKRSAGHDQPDDGEQSGAEKGDGPDQRVRRRSDESL